MTTLTPTSSDFTKNILQSLEEKEPELYLSLLKYEALAHKEAIENVGVTSLSYDYIQPSSNFVLKNISFQLPSEGLITSLPSKLKKTENLIELMYNEIERFKESIESSSFTINSKIILEIAESLSKLQFNAISFDLGSDLNLSIRIRLDEVFLLIINIPIDTPDFFKHKNVFFSLFQNRELLVSYKKNFTELIDSIIEFE